MTIKVKSRITPTIDHLVEVSRQQDVAERQYDNRYFPVARDLRKRTREGLLSVGNVDLYTSIENCYNNPQTKSKSFQTCGSHYCLGCRNTMALMFLGNVNRHIEDGRFFRYLLNQYTEPVVKNGRFYGLTDFERPEYYEEEVSKWVKLGYEKRPVTHEYDNDDILNINAALGICPVRIEDVKKLIQEDGKRWKRFRRRIYKEKNELFWVEVAYEIELVNWNFLRDNPNASPVKQEQVRYFIEKTDERFFREPFLYVHFHGVTNLTHEGCIKVFGNDYFIGGERLPRTHALTGMYIQRLRSTQTLEKNIKKLTSYPFKNAYRYKHSFLGSDFSNGEYFRPEELGRLVSVNKELYGRQGRTLFRSLTNGVGVWDKVEQHLWDRYEMLREYSKTRHERVLDKGTEWERVVVEEYETQPTLYPEDDETELSADSYEPVERVKPHTQREIINELKVVATMLSKIRSKGVSNVSVSTTAELLRDELLKKKLLKLNPLRWKLEPPFEKKKISKRTYSYWGRKRLV